MGPLRGERQANILVSFSNIIATRNQLSNFLTAGSATDSQLQWPSHLSFNLQPSLQTQLYFQGPPPCEKVSPFSVNLPAVPTGSACTNLTSVVNQTDKWWRRRLLCRALKEPCCHCFTSNASVSKLELDGSAPSLIYPKTFSNSFSYPSSDTLVFTKPIRSLGN